MAMALKRAGRRAFSDPSFATALERLLQSYEQEADLSPMGRVATRFDILRCLANLLRLDAAEEENPAIRAAAIEQPVFITGLPRSATTFFHSLLALDPDNAVPRCWQLIHPYPPQRALAAFFCKMGVELQLALFRCLTPGLGGLHPLTADMPQECTDITAHVFQSLRFDTTHHIPSYQNWLDSHGHDAAFRFHRRFLQHLATQHPGRWVLKSPDHVFALDAIRTVYPDAKIVFLHRDPLSVVASCAKLDELLRRPFARHIDRAEIGHHTCNRLVEATDRMVKAASRDDSILHFQYRELVGAPMAAVRKLYQYCGRELSPEAERRMQAFLARPAMRSKHRYGLAEFGLEKGSLSELFAPYTKAFAIDAERAAHAP
ncbi:MAG TPA: sulfotransferase [Rhizomicrobium sp.]|nr:sulfotransferase [Rhizomicrobium sp.]